MDDTVLKLHTTSGTTINVPVSYWSTDGSGLTGNVGIGTSTPNEKLTVVGTISATTDLYIAGDTHTTNLILDPGGYIMPAISSNTIKMRAQDYDGEMLSIGPDLFNVNMDEATNFQITPTQVTFNAVGIDQDFRILTDSGKNTVENNAQWELLTLGQGGGTSIGGTTQRWPTSTGHADTTPNKTLQVNGITTIYSGGTGNVWSADTTALTVVGNVDIMGTLSGTTDLHIDGEINGSTIAATTYNSTLSSAGYKLNGGKYLWLSSGDLQVGNVGADTDIIGISINLQTATTVNDNFTVTGTIYSGSSKLENLFLTQASLSGSSVVDKVGTIVANQFAIWSDGDKTLKSIPNLRLQGNAVTGDIISGTTLSAGTLTAADIYGGTFYSNGSKAIAQASGILSFGDTENQVLIDARHDGLMINGSITTLTNISASGNISGATLQGIRKFTEPSLTNHSHQGDIIYAHHSTAPSYETTPGALYCLTGTTWVTADADIPNLSKGLLGISMGISNYDGFLIKGYYTMTIDVGSASNPLYISAAAGRVTDTAPSSTGQFVRILGYVMDSTNGQIWFDPDKIWIELS